MENGPEDLRKAPVQHSRQTPADHPRLHLHRHQTRPGRHDRAPRRDPRHPLDATHPHDHLTTPALTKPPNAGFRHARERSALNVYARDLTSREAEVLRRIVAGQSTRQMSREMNVTTSTLRTYVKNMLAKLGAHTRLEAAVLATRENLLGDQTA